MKKLLAWIVIIFSGLALASTTFAVDKNDKDDDPKPKKKSERKY